MRFCALLWCSRCAAWFILVRFMGLKSGWCTKIKYICVGTLVAFEILSRLRPIRFSGPCFLRV
jgi:hypothetical protein